MWKGRCAFMLFILMLAAAHCGISTQLNEYSEYVLTRMTQLTYLCRSLRGKGDAKDQIYFQIFPFMSYVICSEMSRQS